MIIERICATLQVEIRVFPIDMADRKCNNYTK